jgi:lectin, mannose-binding 1
MKFHALPTFAAVALAQQVLESQSFGHKDRVSENGQQVQHWRVLGDHHGMPEILSDHIIMTPPWPAYRQSALWAEQPMAYGQWTTDVEFRVSGPETGKSELTIWYTKGNQVHIGTKSLYTVERFEGLAILIDREGSAGQIRAFLNDGRTSYASHPHVESLPFGHCDYQYRNLGRLSKLTIQQDASGFQITIDGNPCFRANSVC